MHGPSLRTALEGFAAAHRGSHEVPATLERKENAMAARTWDAWNYRESAEVSSRGQDLTGFSVEAVDGSIGKIHGPVSTTT